MTRRGKTRLYRPRGGQSKHPVKGTAFIQITTLCLGILTWPATAADRIPAELTGIWETGDAVFTEAEALSEGQAIYLRSDGRGMMIGGPPPIGFMLEAVYDPGEKVIRVRMQLEDQAPCEDGMIFHDPDTATLNTDVAFKRRLERLPPAWSAYVDRKPAACPFAQN